MKLKYLTADLANAQSSSRVERDKLTAERILAKCFKEQADFITDPCLRKTALCPRRSGKSFSCLAMMTRTALLKPDAIIVYICLTRGQAKANLWRELKKFNVEFELGLAFHETDLRATFPNGSTVQFFGGETRQECEKLRGQYFDLVVIDEGKSFQSEILRELINEILTPALADNFGTLAMIGTPGNILAGPFWEATTENKTTRPWSKRADYEGKRKTWRWSWHAWHVEKNVAKPHIWQSALREKEELGIADNDPSWLREWMGEWCPSESLMVYEFSEAKNLYTGALPDDHEWQYLLGLDLGYNDSTAIVVAAFSDTHPHVFQVYDWKEPGCTVDQIEAQVREVMKMFPEMNAMIADTGGLGKTIVASLQEHGLGFEAAEKRDKHDHIMLVNSDLRAGNIKLLADGSLQAEMRLLQWRDESYKKENKDTDNHCCDAFLYLIRFAYHYFWEPAESEVVYGSPEYWKAWELEQEQKAERERNSELNMNNRIDEVFSEFGLDGADVIRWN